MSYAVRCALCGDALGMYEPAILVGDDGVSRTSRAARPALGEANEIVYHLACYEAREASETTDGRPAERAARAVT